MNDDIERRLRESLRARAQDVEPTPELFTRVETTMNRNKRWTYALSALGAAAVVAVAAVTVPNLLDDRVEAPDITDNPTATPSDDPTEAPTSDPTPGLSDTPPAGGVYADYVVLTAQDEVFIADARTGEKVRELAIYDSPDFESVIEALEVRPGSDLDNGTVVLLLRGEGQVVLRYVMWRDGEVVANDSLADAVQVSQDVVADSLPVPAFDPTGSYLAWIEVLRGEQNQVPVLRTISWNTDGPADGSGRNDDASFSLDQLTVEFPGGYAIDDWTWDGQDTTNGRAGHLWVTGAAMEGYLVRIDQQTDGALAMDSKPVRMLNAPEGEAIVDIADTHATEYSSENPSYILSVRGDSGGDAEGVIFTLGWAGHADTGGELPVPDYLTPTASPGDVWMTVWKDGYLIGRGGQASIFTDAGEVRVDANYGDFLR